MPSPWSNLRGPAKLLANSALILLIASGFLGVEAGIMIVLGEGRNIVIKPFVLLGYLEICAMIFSSAGIICGIVGLIFYRPYIYCSEKIYMYRARNTAQITDKRTHFEDVPRVLVPNSEEDGAPD